MIKTKAMNRYNKSFLIVLFAVVLSLCVFVSSVFAWITFTEQYTIKKEETMEFGTVSVSVYNGNSEILVDNSQSPLAVTDNMKIVVKNTGTIRCLVRVMYRFKMNDGKTVPLIVSGTPNSGQINLGFSNSWVLKKLGNYDNLAVGYAFYNARLNPGFPPGGIPDDGGVTEIQIFNNIKKNVSDNVLLEISVDAIAYSGNIYQELEQTKETQDIPVEAYPFGTKSSLPEGWTAWK